MHAPLARRRLGSDVAAFLLAATCAGCGEPGALLCEGCRGVIAGSGMCASGLELRTSGGVPVRAALSFDGVVANGIRRLKGEGQTMLARPFGAVMAPLLRDVALPGTWIVPVPTSPAAFRHRGYRVPELLVRRAGFAPQRALEVTGRIDDQRRLTARERVANVHARLRARHGGGGAGAVIVDDVMTTGATLDEAARALRAADFRVIRAVVLAATPRRAGFG